ncbi:MAG: enoyl-CoA hydratase/isomerase family protein, partial [Marivivens sp.]|nr:enoyl-CoA hydratase/isomerase family protein [Marivivens sp.]
MRDGVAVIVLASPPVNALTHALRVELDRLLDQLAVRDDVMAVSITGEGDTFCAGVDVRQMDKLDDAPSLRTICRKIENLPMPVIVGLRGMVLSGGVELALAAHYRLAEATSKLAMPEASLGLLSSAGATQRLPRLVGAASALDMLLGGRPVSAEQAKLSGLIDGIVTGGICAATLQFAEHLITHNSPLRRVRDMTKGLRDPKYFDVVAKARKTAGRDPLRVKSLYVDAVEAAAMLPFDIGIEFEEDRWQQSLADPQSTALRRLFAAEMMFAMGRSKGAIDAVMIDYGFAQGHFGAEPERVSLQDRTEITERLIGAIAGEGGRILQEGLVRRAADIDAVAVIGMGFPRWHSGPMHAAREIGIVHLREKMRDWQVESPVWTVPRMMDEAAKYLMGFDAISVQRP